MSLNFLATRFTCSWPWSTMVLLCDGRLVCGCADPYGKRVLGDLRVMPTVSSVWTGEIASNLRQDIVNGGSKFCGDCPLKLPLKKDEPAPQRPLDAGPLPSRLYIECTAACNISCSQACCAPETGITRTRQAGMLDYDLFTRVVDEAAPTLGRIDFFNYGEAFLHKRALDMVEYIKSRHPHVYLYTSTNGLALTEDGARRLARSGIDEVTFSIDGARQDTYVQYRQRGDFPKVIRNLAALVDEKRARGLDVPYVNWRYILFAHNDSDDEMSLARATAAEIGVDRLCWEITDHPENMYSRRFVPGTPDYARIENEIWDKSYLGNAIPGATPRARIEVGGSSWLDRIGDAAIRASAGQPIAIQTRVTNLSTRPFPAQASYGRRLVRLGAQLCAADGTVINRDYERAWLPSNLAAGGTLEIPMTLKAPDTPGRYRLKFDLVSEGIDWFEQAGSPTTEKPFVRTVMRRIGIATLPVLVLLSVYVARVTEPVVTAEDIAVTELYTDLASHGRLLVGPYSRFGWHHPGPLYFYLQAPLYVASGRAGTSLFVGAVAINLIAFAILLWTIVRQGRPVLAAAAGIACLAFALRTPRFLASPWTPHVTILPMLACLALASAVASGRTWLLAVTALVAAFVVQTDLALGPPIAIVVLLSLGAVVQRAVREHAVPVRDLVLALCVSVAVWSLPLVDAVRHEGGNLAALLRFFTQANVRLHSTREALAAWSNSLAGVARGDLALAWGSPLHSEWSAWTISTAGALMVLITIVTYAAVRMRRMFDAWFATMTLAAAIAGLWSLTRVRDDYRDYEVLWLVALGALAGAIVVCTAAEHVWSSSPAVERWARRTPPILIAAALTVAALDFRSILESGRRGAGQRDVPPAVAAIEAYLDREHSRSTIVDVDSAWSPGVPIVLRLRQHHRRVAVSPGSLFIFTDAFAPTGREDARVVVQPGLQGAPDSGWQQIFESYWASVYAR